MRRLHGDGHSRSRRVTCIASLALISAMSAFGPGRGTGHAAGNGPSAQAPGITYDGRRWVPSGVFPVAVAPVDWAVPRGYRGELVRRRVHDFPEKLVALTFDDGPDGKVTPRILEALAAHRARATFFVLGERVRLHARLLRQMATAGHAIGNHSYSHPAHPSAQDAQRELRATQELIREVTGRSPSCFRPPYGITKNPLTRLALRRGYATVLWTIDSGDALGYERQDIATRATRAPTPGQIILFHDGPGHHTTAEAVPTILEKLSAAGFQFVTIPELLQAWDQWLRQSRSAAACSSTGAGG